MRPDGDEARATSLALGGGHPILGVADLEAAIVKTLE